MFATKQSARDESGFRLKAGLRTRTCASSRLQRIAKSAAGHAGLLLLGASSIQAATTNRASIAADNWAAYHGDVAGSHYSTLDEINRENVSRLQVAWTYDTGDVGEYEFNNLIIDGVLYTSSPDRNVIALEAATGRELWRFDPRSEKPGAAGRRQRGLVYWSDGDDRRILTTAGNWLYALEAKTGRPVRTFGDKGAVHLAVGLRADGLVNVGLNTPGVIYRDLLLLSVNPGEAVSGAIRALDVRTAALRWVFHTIPRPGEDGAETWPADGWKKSGGASAWAGLTLDERRGIVYAGTETAGPDFWGGDRYGENLFANCIVALDANTGRRLWHRQLVHHDLWDMDLPTPPALLTVKHAGETVDVVAQGTKMGLLFVFNRVTGEPLWPIHKRPAPASEIPGVKTWPTQPVPEKPAPLMRQIYTEADVSTISPEARAHTSERLARAGAFGSFPPPRWTEAIKLPGFDGGFEWGGSASDPDGILYANINEIPWIYQLVPTRRGDVVIPRPERQYMVHCAACHGLDRAGNLPGGMPSLVNLSTRKTYEETMKIVDQGGGRMPAFAAVPKAQRVAIVDFLYGRGESAPGADRTAAPPKRKPADDAEGPSYAFGGFRRWFDQEGYPAIKPPWGTLNAVDLNTGNIKWKIPLGEYPELTARGIPPTGTENYGGPVVTAGGVLFIGATADETFRAFDKDTGKLLWQAPLPFSGTATPSTYRANGKQYVVICAGGGKSNRPAGGKIVAFTLPD